MGKQNKGKPKTQWRRLKKENVLLQEFIVFSEQNNKNSNKTQKNTEYFLDKFTEFSLIEQRQLLPHTDGTDGFFYAVLERK